MFGEKEIVGQTIIRIENNRIVLPPFTYAEPGEEISAMLDPYQKKLLLMKEKVLIAKIMEYDKLLDDKRKEGVLSYQEYHKFKRYFWGILPFHTRTIDQKCRYLLFSKDPSEALDMDLLRRLNLKEQVFAVGTGNALEIYPSENSYHEYQSFIDERRKK